MSSLNIYPDTYKTVDPLFQYLGNLGYTGTINDRMYKHLVAQGYFGSLADMLAQSPSSQGGGVSTVLTDESDNELTDESGNPLFSSGA